MKKQKGFTLIELLVVIAIIALLSTTVMSSMGSARAKGRDARRVKDVEQPQKALDLYYDTCGGYPLLGNGVYVPFGPGGLLTTTQSGRCVGGADSFGTYMSALPVNPTPGGDPYMYCSTPEEEPVGPLSCSDDDTMSPVGNTGYQITFTLEDSAGNLPAGKYVATPKGIVPAPAP